ncbi:hypothetical protein ACFW04_001608 [Cataglyphis niger]
MSDSIKVAIKVRPLIKREKDENLPLQWVVQENNIVATDIELRKRGDCGFQFDHIFDTSASNNDVFNNIVKPIVDAAVNGFNGTVFAYGQTSSGKTYTMMGTLEEPGIIPLAVEYMFDAIANTSGREFLLRVSYLEIYNEKVNDLLSKDSIDLKIHEDINGQVFVKCKEEVTNCPEKVLSMMNKGNKHRRIGETNMNERSSRSHTIFRITIESREASAGSDDAIQVSQLNMVDLAGSERARQTGTTGERFKEGRHINLSLSTLALVIKQLSETQDCSKYINFRDSKLTRLLQASLGGNAMTAIICTVTPAAFDETQCTLSNLSPDTPKKTLRDKICILTKEYLQLQEFTTLEKQLFTEDCSAQIKEYLAKISMLEKQIEIITSDKESYEHIAYENRQKLTAAESRYISAEDKLNMQATELQRIPDLEKKIAQLSAQEIEMQNIPKLQKQIALLTAEKDGYEHVASELRKKLNEAEQHKIILEDKLAVQNVKLESSLEQPLSSNNNMQQVELENQITTMALKNNELQHKITDLQNKLTETELCKNLMKDKLDEQEQHFQTLEERINDLLSEKNVFEYTIFEMKNKLKEAEEINLSMQDKLNERQKEIQKFQNQEKQIEQLVSENNEFKLTIDKLQEQLTDTKIRNNTMEDKNYEHERDAHKSHLEKQIQDVVKEKMESEQINDELRDKLKEMELMNNSMKIQQELHVQKISDLEKQVEDFTIEKNKIEGIVAELKEAELMNSLLKNKLNEYEINICEPDSLGKEYITSELQEKLKEAESYYNSKVELYVQQMKAQKIIDEPKKCIEDLKKNDNEINHLKSCINDLQNTIQDIQKENACLKEQALTRLVLDHDISNGDLSNGDDFLKDLENLSTTRISLDDSAKLSSDLVLKTRELEIKHDVQSLKADIENLHETIYLLTTENSDLANKLSTEKECAEKSTTHFQQTIDELYARNSKMMDEKLELQNNLVILNEQMETLRSRMPEVNSNEEQIMLRYEEQISALTAKNAELLSVVTNTMKELEILKESKSLLYEHDCIYKDELTDLMAKHKYLTTENNELSTDLMDKIEENDGLKEECDILKSKLELLLLKQHEKDNEEQLKVENTLLKTEQVELKANIKMLTKEKSKISNQLVETMEDLDNERKMNSCNNTLQLSTLFNNSLTMNDTMDISIKDDNVEAKISHLQEEVNRLKLLNRKLSDLKLGACTQCAHLQEMTENQRMLKLEVKALTHRLEDSQRKFKREAAKSDSLILKAKEDINISICNSSLNASFLENVNVSYVEEKLQSLNNKLQILEEDHNKLSDLYKEKCNEIEELQNSNVTDFSPNKIHNINTSVKKSPSKSSSRLENMAKDISYLQNDFEKIKEETARLKKGLSKFINEKDSLLDEIKSLKIANEHLLQTMSENELLYLEKTDILENEVRDLTKKFQELSVKCKEVEDAKLVVETDVEFLKVDKTEKEQTINELRQSLSYLEQELDLTKREKEKLNSNNLLEQEYEKKLVSLRSINAELTNSKETISQEFANYCKKSENRFTELNEKINKYSSENDYLKQELIKLRDIENKFETMRNEYQSKSQQDKTLAEDNKKLKNVLNNISKNIIKEIKSLKPKLGAEEFLDKSEEELFQIFLQTILMKEEEIVKTMRDNFNKEKQKLEDDKRQSVDAEKRTTLWAKELESEIEKLQGDLTQREAMSDGLQKEVARLEQLLEDNNSDRNTLKEKINLLEMDLNNLQIEFNKYCKMDTVNEEAINIAQKREKQAQETIRNKEAEFQIKLRSEKEIYTKRIEDLACTIESLKTKNMELINNIEGLEANQEQLKNIIDLKNNELMKNNQIIHKMEIESVQFTEIYNELNCELEKKNLHITEITELLKTKCDDLTEYKAKLDEIVSENTFLKQQIGERKINIEQYKMEIETLKMQNKKEIDAIKDKLNFEELKSIELNKQITELNKKNAVLTEEINILRDDYTTVQHKCITLEKRIRNSTSKIQAEEQMEELKDLNRSLRNNLDGASNRIAELQDAKAELMKQLVILNSQYDAACKDNQELKEMLSSYRSKYNDTYATCEKYDALLQEKNKVALELEAIKVELDQKNGEIKDYISKMKELTEKNKELDQESDELARVIGQHDTENAKLEDQLWSCRIEGDELRDKIKALENKIQDLQPQSMNLKTNVSSEGVKSHYDDCSCTALKNKIRELQMEVVSKNGKIATLELQIRSGSFPYQAKCKELQEHLSAHKNKNSELKAEIKRLQIAMLRTSAKECEVCKQRLLNKRDQICQTMPNTLRFCGTSSGIIEDEIRITKLEKEKQFMKDVCRSRSKTIKELEKQITEYEKLLQSKNS